MAISFFRALLALWAFNFSVTFTLVDAQTQSLRVEMVPQGVINGCCSQAFYNATSQELFNYVSTSTALALQLLGLSMNNIVVNQFTLINTNQCLVRQRSLLRGSDSRVDEAGAGTPQREVKEAASTCSACTKSSCSSYCSGCYLCSSNRRHLERDLQLGGLIGGVLGVPIAALNAAVASVSAGIAPHFAAWLTNGTGAVLANGCMGTPSQLQINVTLA